MSDNAALARTMEVRRADETVALTFTVAAEDLMEIDPRRDLTVYAIFPDPSQADSFACSIQRAAQDAQTPHKGEPNGSARTDG